MRWTYGVWGAWMVLFLLLELPGNWRWVPWVTLSETSWRLEAEHWLIHAIFFGFLIGLLIHIVFKGDMLKTQIAGLVIALLAHFINSNWP